MSSASMALKGTGHDFNPSTLNHWLINHGGYVSGDLFVWASINTLGLKFQGKVGNSQIKTNLDKGNVVICNVHNGHHWVLAHGYNGNNILVNDPGFEVASYSLSEIVDGQNGVYKVGNSPTLTQMIEGMWGRKRNIRIDKGEIMEMKDGGKLEEATLTE